MKDLKLIYKIGIALILLLPIIAWPPLFSPPAFGKGILFRIIFSFLLFLFLYEGFLKEKGSIFRNIIGKIRSKKDIFFFSPLLLLFFLSLSVLFSVDPFYSLFGSPARGGGFVTFALLIVLAYFLFFLLKKEDWKFVWNISFAVAAVACVAAIFQWQGLFEDIIVESSRRPFSFFGNPTVLGSYLATLVFPLLGFAINERKKKTKSIYFLLLFLIIFFVLLTYTRAAFLGIFIGSLYFFILFPKKEKISKVLRPIGLVLISFSLFFVYYVNTASLPSFIEENRTLSGFVNRLDTERALEDPRIGGIITGWEAIKERPFTGYGPENFSYAYSRHYDPETPHIHAGRYWDKAHNLFIEIGVWGGFPALLSFLFIILLAFRALSREKKAENHSLQAALIAFSVANFFTVDVFSLYLLFFLLIAYIFSLCYKEEEVNMKKELAKREAYRGYKNLFLGISLPLLFIFIYTFNITPLTANRDANLAERHRNARRCDQAIEMIEKATQKNSVINSYLLANKAYILERCLDDGEEKTERIYNVVKKVIEIRPSTLRGWESLGAAKIALFEYRKDEELLLGALEAYSKAAEMNPKRYYHHKNKASLQIRIEDYAGALETALTCLEIRDVSDCYFYAGISKAALGEDGEEMIEKAKKAGYDTDSVNSLNALLSSYISAKRYEKTVPIYKKLIEKDPEEMQYRSSLATVYREIGEYQKAREEALKILEISPGSILIIEEFLQTLP